MGFQQLKGSTDVANVFLLWYNCIIVFLSTWQSYLTEYIDAT